MEPRTILVNTIDDYIKNFSVEMQIILQTLRNTIKEAAPNATECINYQMPRFKLNGNLVHFAAYKNHIGFYPAPSAISAFRSELSGYKQAKGSVQFPINNTLPLELIRRMVDYRVIENLSKRAK